MKTMVMLWAVTAAMMVSVAVAQCPAQEAKKAACKCESCGCTAEAKKADCKCDKCACCKKAECAKDKEACPKKRCCPN